MTSGERGNSLENIPINPDLVRHSEYDIEVNDDVALVKHAHKLVITPTYTGSTIEFNKSNNTLLAIAVKDIEDIDIISNLQTSSGKDSDIKIAFNDNRQNKKSITFKVKNNKHLDVIKQQINLLKRAEVDPFIQKKIKSMLNPELCTVCVNDKYVFEFHPSSKLCPNCFKEQYGQILLHSDAVDYHGGHKDYILGGMLAQHQSGSMYLTEKYLIFSKKDKEISKRWQIAIPLSSVILHWDSEEKARRKLVEWAGTNIANFGFGSGFMEKPGKSDAFIISYVDEDGITQDPRFRVSSARKWLSELHKMVIRAKMTLEQQQDSLEKYASRATANCFGCNMTFEIYNMMICDHCMTPFCTMCVKSHTIEPEAKFEAKYLGWHRLYPNAYDVKVFVFSDRIEIRDLKLRIPYISIDDVQNTTKDKMSIFGTGIIGTALMAATLLQKNRTYTVIQYTDAFEEKQVLIFDFKGKLQRAQPMIYGRMVASHHSKKQLLESHKIEDNLTAQRFSIEENSISNDNVFDSNKSKSESKITTVQNQNISEDNDNNRPRLGEVQNSTDDNNNPLRILKVRFAKGEISKEEYEEMRKMLQ
jgi:Short C-terminal domain